MNHNGESEKCIHHWICGDALIRRTMPAFFEEHEPAGEGCEWQACLRCGAVQQVIRMDSSCFVGRPIRGKAKRQLGQTW